MSMSIAATLALVALSLASARGSCLIRYDQVGYEITRDKLAALQCTAAVAAGSTFSLLSASSGSRVFTAAIPPTYTAWSSSYGFVYTLDFSPYKQNGSFILSAVGDTAKSQPFPISSFGALYSVLLSHAAFFYQAQRDGQQVLPSVLSRKPSHLTDKQATLYNLPTYKNDALQGSLEKIPSAAPVDVEGGWFDAGDYIKFVETASYTVDVLLLSLRDYNANSILTNAGLATEAAYGLNLLIKTWDPVAEVLYLQVGIGDGNSKITGDHDLWRLPEKDDTLNVGPGDPDYYIKYRPVFANANAQHSALISPNLAGRVAAAFALCSQIYRSSNASLASSCLRSSQRIYALANTAPSGKLVTALPFDYYPETEWRDDLHLASSQLYLATGNVTYLQQACKWATAYINQGDADTFNLYDVGALAHYELHKILSRTASPPPGCNIAANLLAALKGQLDAGMAQARKDVFRFGTAYDSGDDLVPAAFGYALTADLYAELIGTRNLVNDTYVKFGLDQTHWILGYNAWGVSNIIGAGTVFPFCPQHQVANLAGSLDGRSPVLLGAVVDGPSVSDNFDDLGIPDGAKKCPPSGTDTYKGFTGHGVRYMDDVRAWPSVEPADDYSVVQVMLFARYISS
eukprot:TRINITY_DN7080_c0_g1_i5.p1 TRINITY_DN7080_c0_g1~~TRINITY_DN7080_c0_g1_i5.p1  ORF type:complete len:629 (+),score=125.01 TRINITY_DN7080_c0_g1_i5:157-2043(+)